MVSSPESNLGQIGGRDMLSPTASTLALFFQLLNLWHPPLLHSILMYLGIHVNFYNEVFEPYATLIYKQQGNFYQNNINPSLTFTQRPGN